MMFPAQVYIDRRAILRRAFSTGLLLFPGHGESPMNYRGNTYPFRQDSSFLYYFGLDQPGLAVLIDLDAGREIIFGADPSVDDIVWTGPLPSVADLAAQVGIHETAPPAALAALLSQSCAQGRPVHFLPPYRAEQQLQLAQWLGQSPAQIAGLASVPLVKAVVAQRAFKSPAEVAQIEQALDVTHAMQTLAMSLARPGVTEWAVAGAMEGLVASRGLGLAFPTIFTVHGETLHNMARDRVLRPGDLAVNDCGATSPLHYAGDITRTLPIGGRFNPRQREIYQIVLDAQQRAIAMATPGVEFRDVHRAAAETLVSGLIDLGLMRGPAPDAVAAGAHTLFFPCGVGHMMGLDVHDMESLGEDYVGYTDAVRRNPEFGWKWLRLARALEPGFVVTVEPGIYFIPVLLDRWRAEKKCSDFIDYDRFEQYRDFGGIRLEDDVLVTPDGHRVLGPAIPRTADEVEAATAH